MTLAHDVWTDASETVGLKERIERALFLYLFCAENHISFLFHVCKRYGMLIPDACKAVLALGPNRSHRIIQVYVLT